MMKPRGSEHREHSGASTETNDFMQSFVNEGRKTTHSKLQNLAGTEMKSAPGAREWLDTKETLPASVVTDIEDHLRDISTSIAELKERGLEHRVDDIWDVIPIAANVRSNTIATREAELINHLKEDVHALEQTFQRYRMPLSIEDLKQAVSALSAPAGITKFFATIMPSVRRFHRGLFGTRRNENVARAASDLKRNVRAMKNSNLAA